LSADSDKTEDASDHKLQEERKKGNVMKSQDVISTLGMLAACGAMYASGAMMYSNIEKFWLKTWDRIQDPTNVIGNSFFWEIVDVISVVCICLAPLMVGCFIMGIIANVAQIKLLFTVEPLKPSLKKINPISGFKQIFSVKSLVELIKQLLKLAVVGWICYSAVSGELEQFKLAPTWDLMRTVSLVGELTLRIVKNVLLGMIVIMGADYFFQKKQFAKQMKMSHKDLKDEYKETEGNPHIKAKIRQKMQQSAQGGMMAEVPNANAVVTNPTHLAIAIKYNKEDCPVPTVVAKGERLIAQAIKLKAEDHDIPVVENVELARALFGACEVGQAIPTELYKAVAEILAYVLKLKKKKEMRRRTGGARGRGRR
jgi:flagellar biosynthetic protein FlhB